MIQEIAPHQMRITFEKGAEPAEESYILLFDADGKLLFIKEETGVRLPRRKEFAGELVLTFLFRLDGEACFLVENAEGLANGTFVLRPLEPMSDKCRGEDYFNVEYLTQRSLRGMHCLPKEHIFASWVAGQLFRWYRDNRFCGTCGAKTVHGTEERSRVCPVCGRTIYPRINPCIIAAVTKGDEILLTRYRGPRGTFNALVAGFVEIGETLEDTVRREVMEEAGLRVKNIRYYKSQPWSIADDLLAGFFCDLDGSPAIHMDANELSSAIWTRREDVVLQPDDASLTNEMMKLFRDGKEPR